MSQTGEMLNWCTGDLKLGINNTHGKKLNEGTAADQMTGHPTCSCEHQQDEFNKLQQEEGENFSN